MKDFYIVDFHAHIFPKKLANKAVAAIGKYYNLPMYHDGSVESLLSSGNRIGTKKYIVHSTATRPEQTKSINDFIINECRKQSSFIGFGTLHPELLDFDKDLTHIKSSGLKGIKLHPEFQNFAIDDERVIEMIRAIGNQLPILVHMGDENVDTSSPARLANVMDQCPEVTIIAAHFGGYQAWDDSIKYLVGRENLYFDTSSSLKFLNKDIATKIINNHGVDKFLFGVDYPMWDHKEEYERFEALPLSNEQRAKILGINALKLLSVDC